MNPLFETLDAYMIETMSSIVEGKLITYVGIGQSIIMRGNR